MTDKTSTQISFPPAYYKMQTSKGKVAKVCALTSICVTIIISAAVCLGLYFTRDDFHRHQEFTLNMKNQNQEIPMKISLNSQDNLEYVTMPKLEGYNEMMLLRDYNQGLVAMKDLTSGGDCLIGEFNGKPEDIKEIHRTLTNNKNVGIKADKEVTLSSLHDPIHPEVVAFAAGKAIANFCNGSSYWIVTKSFSRKKRGGMVPSMTPPISPIMTPGMSPAMNPGMSPMVTPGVSPMMTPGMSPMMSPGMSPMMTPGMSPMMSPGMSPMMSPGMSPMMSPGIPATLVNVNPVPLSQGLVNANGQQPLDLNNFLQNLQTTNMQMPVQQNIIPQASVNPSQNSQATFTPVILGPANNNALNIAGSAPLRFGTFNSPLVAAALNPSQVSAPSVMPGNPMATMPAMTGGPSQTLMPTMPSSGLPAMTGMPTGTGQAVAKPTNSLCDNRCAVAMGTGAFSVAQAYYLCQLECVPKQFANKG